MENKNSFTVSYYAANKYNIWCCPGCGRTVKAPEVRCWQPNLNCTCALPNCIYIMVQVA